VRILHLGKFHPPAVGGIELFVRDLAVALDARGAENLLLVHHHRPLRRSCRETADGLPVVRTMTFGQLAYAPLAPSLPWHLLRLVRTFRPDIVHVHMPNTSGFAALLLPPRLPVVLHWHADVVPSRIDAKLALLYPPYRLLERKLLTRAAAVIATSQPYLDASRALAPFRDKCAVVPLGIDPGRLQRPAPKRVADLRRSYGDRPLVVALGRFAYYKGFQHLVRAATELPQACVVIIGDGPERPAVSRLVSDLGLTDRVFLPGQLPDAAAHEHLAACDLFCLPSVERTEAFGLSLLEAMAFGKPLLTTALAGSGVSWVNQDGQTGLVVPPADPPALAAVIRTLLDDPARAAGYGRQALERLDQQFHINEIAERIELIYRTTLVGV